MMKFNNKFEKDIYKIYCEAFPVSAFKDGDLKAKDHFFVPTAELLGAEAPRVIGSVSREV